MLQLSFGYSLLMMLADNIAILASDTRLFLRLRPSLVLLDRDVMLGFHLGPECITLLALSPRCDSSSAADSLLRNMLLARATSDGNFYSAEREKRERELLD